MFLNSLRRLAQTSLTLLFKPLPSSSPPCLSPSISASMLFLQIILSFILFHHSVSLWLTIRTSQSTFILPWRIVLFKSDYFGAAHQSQNLYSFLQFRIWNNEDRLRSAPQFQVQKVTERPKAWGIHSTMHVDREREVKWLLREHKYKGQGHSRT